MENNQLNYEQAHTFNKGNQKDLANHAEAPETYVKGINGRLYSENGILAYESITGTKLVYENNNITKYLGYWAFNDELIVWTKTNLPVTTPPTTLVSTQVVTSENFSIRTNDDNIYVVPFAGNYQLLEFEIETLSEIENIDEFEQNLSCVGTSNVEEGNYLGLFTKAVYTPLQLCDLFSNDVPVNNLMGADGIWSFKLGANDQIIGTLLWNGYLNIPEDGKITTIGIYENEFYKRVYFSDYLNVSRVINIKDNSLSTRNPNEFSLFPTGTLLNPRIIEIAENGSLKAMSVLYMYRLITENGQITDYSATSKIVKIPKEINGYEFAGGDISEITNKSVKIQCIVPDFKNFKEIELIAVEFEANLTPTSIVLVGKKPVDYYVEFEHFGTESEFLQNITLSDIFKNSINWKYNSDFESKNNKLLVCGLRNDPSYINSKNIAIDFGLHSWAANGDTHTCLLNPNPVLYNYIDRNMNSKFMYVKRKLYRRFKVFGSFKMYFKNTLTGNFYELEILENNYFYKEQTQAIVDFLLDKQDNDVNFSTWFPNLLIEEVSGGIIFKPINDTLNTDFYHYSLIFSTPQVIFELDNDLEMLPLSWPTNAVERESRLVYGAVSNGWFNGNGVRVTMRSYEEEVAYPSTDWHNGSNPIVNINAPSTRKGFMKGEIYRLGVACFKNGNRLFTIVLGDLKIPDVGQPIRELDDDGFLLFSKTIENYTNMVSSTVSMRAQKIELQFDVRINCELSKEIDSYQIVHVERTEENRTILCQGLSQPTERYLRFSLTNDVTTKLKEEVTNKWCLPNTGGPVYDRQGLLNYDNNPNNDDMNLWPTPSTLFPIGPWKARVTTNRKIVSFDSPDIIHNKISDRYVSSCNIELLSTLSTDHEKHNIIGGYNRETSGERGIHTYRPDGTSYNNNDNPTLVADFNLPKYSQKIPFAFLSNQEDYRPLFVNVSVFAKYQKRRVYNERFSNVINPSDVYTINKSKAANEGQILSGFQLNDTFQVSNNALSLHCQAWFYNELARSKNSSAFSTWRVNSYAAGRDTIFIKTDEDLYTDINIAQTPFIINSKVNIGNSINTSTLKANDSHIVFNLKRNNQDSIYGGRTDYAYSSNEYIALSDVMPVLNDQIHSQRFKVEGDTYTHLYFRNKTSFRKSPVPERVTFDYAGNEDPTAFNSYNAWCYGVILESTVEPRYNHQEEFYRLLSDYNFFYEEQMNSAYLQENDLKKSIPVPYNFKDDPNQNNLVAVSDTKLRGDYFDAWSVFRINEFYELDKDKGTAFNFAKQNDQVYVIQEMQTSKLYIDERNMINPENGQAIQVAQGNGASIAGHEIISEYGTSNRRAIVDNIFGFIFYDERKQEFVKIEKPLLIQNNLALDYRTFFEQNKIVDVEGYYDDKYKETNLRFRTATNKNFVLSYNEALQVFNGRIEYDNDLYMVFQNKIYAPYSSSNKIGLLNYGKELNFFESDKCIHLGIVSAPNYPYTKINKSISIVLNTNYPILKAIFKTSLNQSRVVNGNHFRYIIKEGVHTVPAKNMSDVDDLRGEWCYIELISKSFQNQKLRFFSIINHVRNSYK